MPEDEFPEWRRENWLRFLEGERAGGRSILLSWLSLLVALLGILIGSLFSLARVDFAFALILLCILVWAMVVVLVAAYVWYQYLGAIRSLSKVYFGPEYGPWRIAKTFLDIDMREVAIRDAGNLFAMVFYNTSQLEDIHNEDGVRSRVRRIRLAFWTTMTLSLAWLIGLFVFALRVDAMTVLISLVVGAIAAAIATGAAIRSFTIKAGELYLLRRSKERGQTPLDGGTPDVSDDARLPP
jgi:hypothetical protein